MSFANIRQNHFNLTFHSQSVYFETNEREKKTCIPIFGKNNHYVQLQPRKGTNYEHFVLFGQMKNMYSTNLTAALPLDENRLQWRSQCAENSKDIQI